MLAVRERQEQGKVKTVYIHTDEQLADIMTKPLAPSKFNILRARLVVALIMMLVFGQLGTEARRLLIQGLSSQGSEIRHLTLKMNNPCSSAQAAEEELRGPVEINEEAKFNVSLIEITKNICKSTFDKRVVPAFNDIKDCLQPFDANQTRDKRDLAAVAGIVSTAASVIVGVTNLIKGSSGEAAISNKGDTLRELEKVVDAGSKLALTNRATRSSESEREIMIVSETSQSHLAQVREESAKVPMLVWTTFHVANELYAGAANLKAIKQQCSLGRLATTELAEMLENESLASILPDDTVLRSITVNSHDRIIEFVFSVERELVLSMTELGIGAAILISVILFIALIGANLHVVTMLSKKNSNITGRESISLSSYEASRRMRLGEVEL